MMVVRRERREKSGRKDEWAILRCLELCVEKTKRWFTTLKIGTVVYNVVCKHEYGKT